MRKHIHFGGLSTTPTDHESADGESAHLANLIAEDSALRPLGLRLHDLGSLPAGSRLAAIHPAGGSRHLIVETASDGHWTYYWTDTSRMPEADSQLTLHHLCESTERANAFATVGSTLCITTDSTTRYALFDETLGDYCLVGYDDLLYHLTISQDHQQQRELSVPITTALAAHLDSPTTVVAARQTAVERLFAGFYDTDEAYTTGATMVAAAMESAAAHEVALLGQGTHKHLRLGIAALRMADGSHLLWSNPFALLPATLPTQITADREAATLHATISLHRHTLTIDMRQAEKAARLVVGVDIFLTRELTMLDLRQAATIVTDMEGHTTSLTFAHLDRQATLELVDRLPFYKVLTVGPDQWGLPVLVPQTQGEGEEARLADLRRGQAGARVATGHDGRLSLGSVARTLTSPFDIGLTYRYLTLDTATREALGPDSSALDSELVAGSRPDIADQPYGQTCDIVVHAQLSDPTVREAWWSGQVQYPIPGMMMAAHDELTQLTYHVRVSTPEGTRYYTTTQRLDRLRQKGMRLSLHTATGQSHRVERPALHSLLLQQARVLHLDADTHDYQTTYMLWQTSTAEEWEAQAARARTAWTLTRDTSLIRTSQRGNPLIFPTSLNIHVGDGEVTRLVANTRRTADGLFGDGQYYAFTTKGLWVMRLSGERWQAQQTVSRDGLCAGSPVVTTGDAVVYATAGRLMMVRGAVSTCLTDMLHDLPFNPHALPHYTDILATEPTLNGNGRLPNVGLGTFLTQSRLLYDAAHRRLWLHHPDFPQWALVYSLRGKTWGTATTAIDSSISDGDNT